METACQVQHLMSEKIEAYRRAPVTARMALLRRICGESSNRSIMAQLIRGFATHAPTVFDKMIQVNVTDLVGKRHLLRGKEGDRLIDLLAEHIDELGGDAVVGLSPEGRGEKEAHVAISNEFLASIPALTGEDTFILKELAPEHSANSRLASKIKLDRQFNNLSLALRILYPWRTV